MKVTTLNIENLGVDHTGDFLFEDCGNSQSFIFLSSFSSSFQKRRITERMHQSPVKAAIFDIFNIHARLISFLYMKTNIL
jgi:hypothetical protein